MSKKIVLFLTFSLFVKYTLAMNQGLYKAVIRNDRPAVLAIIEKRNYLAANIEDFDDILKDVIVEKEILHLASKIGNEDILELLLKESPSVDVNFIDQAGDTPLHVAIKFRHSSVVKTLLKYGANPNVKNIHEAIPLILASFLGFDEIVKILLEEASVDVNAKTKNGQTALDGAIYSESEKIVEMLLGRNADPNIQSITRGNTPLIDASMDGNVEIVKLLLKYGADPNIKNKDKDTALMAGSMVGKTEIVKLLLEYGADPYIKNNYGFTSLDCAINRGYKDIEKEIIKYKPKLSKAT